MVETVPLAKAVTRWGQKNLGSTDPKAVLTELRVKRKMTAPEIAKTLSTTRKRVKPETVRHALKKNGLPPAQTKTFVEKIKELGYPDIMSFFLDPKIAAMRHEKIAQMTGHTTQCVWSHFHQVKTAMLGAIQ